MERSQPKYQEVSGLVEETPPGPQELKKGSTIGYALPFVVFIGFLAIHPLVPVPQPVRFLSILALLLIVSRNILPPRPSRLFASVLLGIAVFSIWIGPDVLIPGYRSSFLFSNSIVGHPEGATP